MVSDPTGKQLGEHEIQSQSKIPKINAIKRI
jgi:hypothetical protein